MNDKLPPAVQHYLKTITHPHSPVAYLKLDATNRIVELSSNLDRFAISELSLSTPANEQLPLLEGLLPIGAQPLILTNAQIGDNQFFDLHIYQADDHQWVLLLDNTEAGTQLQFEQQRRLGIDIIKERRSRG